MAALNLPFSHCGRVTISLHAAPIDGRPSGRLDARWEIMDETVQKSCWGVTAKAVIGIAGLMLLAWLATGAETAAVVAAAAG